jgi:Xaa-Pro dipeptidase
MIQERMDVPPMIFTGNPLIIKPRMVFLMDSEAQLAMNLGETYLVTETGNERLGKQKLDLVIL